jgi:hypothetical protein
VVGLCLCNTRADEVSLPKLDDETSEVFERGQSPDGKWQITMPKIGAHTEWGARHSIVSTESGEIQVVIDGEATSNLSSHGSLFALWSEDSERLLWIVHSKWSPLSVNYLMIRDGDVAQINVYRAAVIEILGRVRQELPEAMAEAITENAGNGTAYPMGFVIDLVFEEDPPSTKLPLRFTIELTSNPKGIEDESTLEATMKGTLNDKQSLTWSDFEASYTLSDFEAFLRTREKQGMPKP